MTDDVAYLPPDQPAVLGKVALEAFIRPFYEQFDGQITMSPEEVLVRGDLAVEWGILKGTITPIAGGDTADTDGKYLYVYKRQPDGSWKVIS